MNVTAKISDIPGNWDHKNQTFTDRGLQDLKSVMKNEKYLKYALSLTSKDYDAESVKEAVEGMCKVCGQTPCNCTYIYEDQELTEMAYDSMMHPKYGKKGFMSVQWWYGFMVLRAERLAVIKTAAKL